MNSRTLDKLRARWRNQPAVYPDIAQLAAAVELKSRLLHDEKMRVKRLVAELVSLRGDGGVVEAP